MGDMPKLPPGLMLEDDPDHSTAYRTVVAGTDHVLTWGPDHDEALTDAADVVGRLLHAAITAAATDAGVVLPEGYDVGEVLRDGVRAHGWWWEAKDDGGLRIVAGGDDMGFARPHGGVTSAAWSARGIMTHMTHHPTREAAARALWDAVGPDGLTMPPLPEVSDD